MRKWTLVFAVAALVPSAVAAAQDRPDVDKGPRFTSLEKQYLKVYPKAREAFGYATVGRNIVRTGMTNTQVATQAQIRESKDRMERWLEPPATPTSTSVDTGGGYAAVASSGCSGSSNAYVADPCGCEGSPTSVSPDGTYRGKYQFDQQTWEAHGGTGDPAAAPEAVQDEVASRIQYDAWPNC